MKNNKFDFFGSPHPRHFNLANLQLCPQHQNDDQNQNQEKYFNTPVRSYMHLGSSPVVNIDPFFTCQHKRDRRKYSEDFFKQDSEQPPFEEEQSQKYQQIMEKIEYSEDEDLLIPITPQKPQVVEQAGHQMNTTIRKKGSIFSTPLSEGKIYERGLKKLAYEAYKFVSHQKKTTYKEVAKKLINQLNDQHELQIQKKGEMNIKRRVYDALNVLIALGLLKRNGNKILGKKVDIEQPTIQKMEREKQRKKQEVLEDQLMYLKSQYQRKLESIREKERLYQILNEKLDHFTLLEQRNKKHYDLGTVINCENRIELPFLMIGLAQNNSQIKEQTSQIKPNINIWQSSQNVLMMSYSNNNKIQIIGDLDLIKHLKLTAGFEGDLFDKLEKNKRQRNR